MNAREIAACPHDGEESLAEALPGLVRAIDYAQGFWLGFVKCNTPEQRRRAAGQCREALAVLGIRLVEIELTESVAALLPLLRERLAQAGDAPGKTALFIYGLEHSLSSAESHPQILAHLNYQRESFRRHLPHALTFWLPDYAMTMLIRGAPDFWAWRSTFHALAPERETSDQLAATHLSQAFYVTDSLTLAAKRERLALLQGLLDDYHTLGDGPHEQKVQANLLYEIGLIHQLRGEYAAALEFYQRSLQMAETLGNQAGVAKSLHQIGSIHQLRGEYAPALEYYQRSLQMRETLGDQAGVAKSLHQIGSIHQLRGEYAAALEFYQRSLQMAETPGNQAGVAKSLHQIGSIHQLRGEYAAALEFYQRSLQMAETLGNQAGVAKSLHQIGSIHQLRGEYAAALEFSQRSLQMAETPGNQAGVATSLGQIGQLLTETERYDEALPRLLAALSLFIQLESPNAGTAVNVLRQLRAKWGVENFDAAWHAATEGAELPDWLEE